MSDNPILKERGALKIWHLVHRKKRKTVCYNYSPLGKGGEETIYKKTKRKKGDELKNERMADGDYEVALHKVMEK